MAAFAAPVQSTAMTTSLGRVAGALTSFATAIVILGVTMIPFFTPAWIHFEQDRAGSAVLTGYTEPQLQGATDSIVHDLLLGGDFGVVVLTTPVLDPAEQAHMRDVRAVFAGFAVLAVASAASLFYVARRARSGAGRTAVRVAIRRGASSLTVLLVVLGVIAVVAFDAAFEIFHSILFPGGNFDFDPRTEKLVQLFPEQFWSETALVYGAVALGVSLLVAWSAGRRAPVTSEGTA